MDLERYTPDDDTEWKLQADMRERGRRLTAFKQATEGKVLSEVHRGEWEYVPIADAKPRRVRKGEWSVPA